MRSAATAETEISEGNWLLRDALWDRAERFLIGVLGTLAMLVGLVQVVGRYVAPRYAISWAEEVIVYLIVWGIMLAASQLVRTDGHVRPDLVLRAAPARIQRWMEVINCIAALAFCAGLAWYGWSIVTTSWQLDERSSSDLQFPMWLYSAAIPLGATLMTGRYLIRLYRYLFAFDPQTMTVGGHIPEHERTVGLSPSPPREN
jgi:C4-dicarboxylate transporter, DctQ subunit